MRLLVFLLALSVVQAPVGSTPQDETPGDWARRVLRGSDRGARLAAFERLRSIGHAPTRQAMLDAALASDDGVLQAAALREVFAHSTGFELSLAATSTTTSAGRAHVEQFPRYAFFGESGGQGFIDGALSGTLMTWIFSLRYNEPCVVELRPSSAWTMSGPLRCATLGHFVASLDLSRMRPRKATGRDDLAFSVSDRRKAAELLDALPYGEASHQALAEQLGQHDPLARRTAVRPSLCAADVQLRQRALTVLVTEIESVVIRPPQTPSTSTTDPRSGALASGEHAPGISKAEHLVVRAARDGRLAGLLDSAMGTGEVDENGITLTFEGLGGDRCDFRLRPDCSATDDDGNPMPPTQLLISQTCDRSGKTAAVSSFSELRWMGALPDARTLEKNIAADAQAIGDLLDLLARPDEAEQLGALTALAASSNSIARDLAIEASLTSPLASARAIGFRLLLDDVSTVILQISEKQGTMSGQFGSIENLGSARDEWGRVKIRVPGSDGDAALQIGSTHLSAARDGWFLSLELAETGELRGTLSHAGRSPRTDHVRAVIR